MKAINDFLLNLFTDTGTELRPYMTFPNLEDGIVSASDGHALMSIPEIELELCYQTNVKYPRTNKLISELEAKNLSSVKAKVSDIAKELTKARLVIDKNSIKCKECNGSGEVEWEYEDKTSKTHYSEHECPVCDGEGSLETDAQFARIKLEQTEGEHGNCYSVIIGDLYFHPFQLYRLFMVALVKGYEEIEIFYDGEKYGQAITYIDNIKVLVMLMLKLESNSHE